MPDLEEAKQAEEEAWERLLQRFLDALWGKVSEHEWGEAASRAQTATEARVRAEERERYAAQITSLAPVAIEHRRECRGAPGVTVNCTCDFADREVLLAVLAGASGGLSHVPGCWCAVCYLVRARPEALKGGES